MQLGQTESVGPLDNHYRGVGNVHAHFNHHRGNKHVDFTFSKALHNPLLLHRPHLPVKQLNLKFRKNLTRKILPLISRRLYLCLLVCVSNPRIHKVCLLLHPQALSYKLLCLLLIGPFDPTSYNSPSARWTVPDNRNIQISKSGHRKRPRYGGRRHDKTVRH